MSEGQPGFGWAIVVRGGGERSDLYYLLAEWESEEALNAAGATAEKRACIERHQPYQYMVSSPALREVVEVVVNERSSPLPEAGEVEAVHRILDGPAAALPGTPVWRVVMEVAGGRGYELTLWRRGEAPGGAEPAELLLMLPRP